MPPWRMSSGLRAQALLPRFAPRRRRVGADVFFLSIRTAISRADPDISGEADRRGIHAPS